MLYFWEPEHRSYHRTSSCETTCPLIIWDFTLFWCKFIQARLVGFISYLFGEIVFESLACWDLMKSSGLEAACSLQAQSTGYATESDQYYRACSCETTCPFKNHAVPYKILIRASLTLTCQIFQYIFSIIMIYISVISWCFVILNCILDHQQDAGSLSSGDGLVEWFFCLDLLAMSHTVQDITGHPVVKLHALWNLNLAPFDLSLFNLTY